MVVHAYYPLAEPRVQREARAAREAGFDVTVLALRGPDEPPGETTDGIHVRRVRLRHVRGTGLGRLAFEYGAFCVLAAGWLAARSARRPFAIIHFHGPPDFIIAAGLFPRLLGSRLILDIHDLSSHMFGARVGGVLGAMVSRALVWVERLASAVADEVVTVHEPYRSELVRHGVPPAKVHVVMNSVDHVLLERSHQVGSLRPRAATFRLAYHGTLTSWYGTDLVVDAVKELREKGLDVDAVLLGDGDAVPMLRRQIAERGLENYIYLSGRYVPIEAALATVACADCGVIPNRASEINRFALSSKLFEYVALGVPVVVAHLETLATYFGPDEVTFFEPGEATSLAAAVRWVYEHRDAARWKVHRAQARADDYSWLRNRAELVRLYRPLARMVE
jgi:glycosyltransferase involved in cell wall biosynthesis